jgi:hypothetical protein
MNPPEIRCPRCSGILSPVVGRPELLQCLGCRNQFSPRTSTGQIVESVLMAIGKAILVLAGIALIAGALIFAGCLFMATNMGR